MLQIPPVQTWIAKKAVEIISPKINGTISIDKIAIVFFNRVMVQDAYVVGNHGATVENGDTLVSFKKLSVTISPGDLLRKKIKAYRISISDGSFAFIKEGENGESNLSRIFNVTKKEKKKGGGIPDMSAAEIRLKNFDFRYVNHFGNKVYDDPECMDYTYIGALGINAKLNKIKTTSGVLTCRIQELSATERCGLNLESLRGDFTLGPYESRLDNFRLKESFSEVKGKYLSFKYEKGKEDVADFVNKVVLDADFQNSTVDFRTIRRFAPALSKSRLRFIVNGCAKGTISDLRSDDLTVSSESGNTSLNFGVVFAGLPDINNVHFSLNVKGSHFKTPDLAAMISSFSGTQPNKSIASFSPDITFSYQSLIKGTFSDLTADGTLSSPVGKLSHDIHMKNSGKKDGVNIAGDISTQDLDLGAILRNKLLGKVTLNTGVDATLRGDEYGGMIAHLDTTRIKRLGFNGYDYSNITALGIMEDNSFDGRIVCHDPNLDFLFQGIVKLPKKDNLESKYVFFLEIPYANLTTLNLDKNGAISDVHLRTLANLTIDKEGSMLGNVDISNLSFSNKNGRYDVKSINLSSLLQDNFYHLNFSSPFLTADYSGEDSPTLFISRISDLLFYDHFDDVFTKEKSNKDLLGDLKKGHSAIGLKTLNMKPVCDIFIPGLYVADSTSISLELFQNDSVSMTMGSNRLALNSNFIKDMKLQISGTDSLVDLSLTSANMNIAGIVIDSNLITTEIEDGVINLGMLFCATGNEKSELQFASSLFFSRDKNQGLQTNIYIHESELFIQGHRWCFSPSDLSIGKKRYALNNFRLFNNEQEIKIDGLISENPSDTMKMNLNNFDISILNSFVKNNFNIQGDFTGEMMINDMYGNAGILMDITGKDVYLFDNEVGTLSLTSKWNPENEVMDLNILNTFRNSIPINVSGYYKPSRKYLYVNAALQDFALTYISPFLTGVMSITNGSMSGNLTLMGPLDNLVITSTDSRFDNFSFTPTFTQVPYIMNGGVHFTQSGITFDNIVIKDRFEHEAQLTGGLTHHFFKDMFLDAKLRFRALECLNTTEKDNTTFYGTASGSGEVAISGPIENLLIDASFATGEKTAIHVPLSGSSSASSKQLLTFTSESIEQKFDPYDSLMAVQMKAEKSVKSNVQVKAKALVTPDAEIFIEINKDVGDILKCKGQGTVDVSVNPARNLLDLRGEYTVTEGAYHLVLLGIISKDFTIVEGGSIAFNGGIKNTSLDIGAMYKTKASVSTLISDTTSVGSRRNVDCGINLKGSITNPEIGFSIDIPDLDPITKGRVESALSTNAKIQKQFMALMISGSFVPDEQSGIVNNSTMLYSNASEILSNQFNNIFRQLGVPLDLGLNYQPGQGKKDMFDVALSYQAFNNRLILNGSVGNSQSSSNWAGNFDAEVKMDKKGKFRFTLFTRAADQYTNYLDNTQRSGFGFTFQDEFNSFREIFMSKKRKEKYETEQMLKAEAEIKKEAEQVKIKKEEVNKEKEDPLKLNDAGFGQYKP